MHDRWEITSCSVCRRFPIEIYYAFVLSHFEAVIRCWLPKRSHSFVRLLRYDSVFAQTNWNFACSHSTHTHSAGTVAYDNLSAKQFLLCQLSCCGWCRCCCCCVLSRRQALQIEIWIQCLEIDPVRCRISSENHRNQAAEDNKTIAHPAAVAALIFGFTEIQKRTRILTFQDKNFHFYGFTQRKARLRKRNCRLLVRFCRTLRSFLLYTHWKRNETICCCIFVNGKETKSNERKMSSRAKLCDNKNRAK